MKHTVDPTEAVCCNSLDKKSLESNPSNKEDRRKPSPWPWRRPQRARQQNVACVLSHSMTSRVFYIVVRSVFGRTLGMYTEPNLSQFGIGLEYLHWTRRTAKKQRRKKWLGAKKVRINTIFVFALLFVWDLLFIWLIAMMLNTFFFHSPSFTTS
jgi:hypothetical protein